MLDRYGDPIFVGWAPHELLWVQAAMSLEYGQREAAYRDIAEMTGRTFTAIQCQVTRIRAKTRRLMAKVDAETVLHRSVVLPARTARGPGLISDIRQPTKAQLMAGR